MKLMMLMIMLQLLNHLNVKQKWLEKLDRLQVPILNAGVTAPLKLLKISSFAIDKL